MDTINYPIIDPYNTIVVQYTNSGLIITRFVRVTDENGEASYEPVIDIFEAKVWGLQGYDSKTLREALYFILDAFEIYNHGLEITSQDGRTFD